MENNRKMDHFLAGIMATDNSGVQAPGLSAMMGAREKIMARKKTGNENKSFMAGVIAFFNLELKLYHLGISVLLMMMGTFYITESHYSSSGGQNPGDPNFNTLSIHNTTLSINSSTMLTSIPTLRN